MASLNDLWGGTLKVLTLDPVEFTAELEIRVDAVDQSATHSLKLLGVSEFHFSNSIPLPWTYAELTEIKVVALPDNRVRVEMILWSEDAPMTIEASAVELDGNRVQPTVP